MIDHPNSVLPEMSSILQVQPMKRPCYFLNLEKVRHQGQ